MRVKPELKGELVSIIAEHVPPAVLAEVVAIQGAVASYEELVKLSSEDPAANAQAVALRVVDAYQALDRIEILLRGLTRRDPANLKVTWRISELVLKNMDALPAGAPGNGELDEASNLQAAIAKRAQMLRSPALLSFMTESEGKICVIATESLVGGQRRLMTGTGFLVGPDLVLTARHVLGDHIAGGVQNEQQSGKRCAFFDHTDGPPIDDPALTALPGAVRRVEFHPTEWLRKFSEAFPGDGTFDAANDAQIAGLRGHLDMVLIKLAEPVGKYSRRRTGGARRGWIDLPPAAAPQLLAMDDRIIIPQHPGGHPQQIDFGRYNHSDPSETRIRYNTETEKGTSGAPCFDQTFNLVGMHNAGYVVPARPRLNQAIRFDHILPLLQNDVFDLPPASKLWSVSESDQKPDVIVGRDAIQEWIKLADTDAPTGMDQRVFIVEGARARCGKSFTTRILQAARRDKRLERIVTMSRLKDPVPQEAADFLRLIGGQLRIPTAELDRMPARPSDRLPEGGDGDKLAPWLSRDLPVWFARVLGEQRIQTVDLQAEAATIVAIEQARNRAPSAEDLKLAAQLGPVLHKRELWQRVWIVLDDVTEQTVSSEVKELLASLLGTRLTEEALAPELRRLRWIFLGWRPDFIAGLTGETLDQLTDMDEDIAVCVRALVESLNRQVKAESIDRAVEYVQFTMSVPEMQQAYDNPDTRLATLQGVIGALRPYLNKRLLSQ